jgi:prepilin-type processing-associated H-X9-DG protein
MSWEARHNGLCNFGFVDGHAKALNLEVLRGGSANYGKYLWAVEPLYPGASL